MMKMTFEICLVDTGKKAAEQMAEISAKLVRSGICSVVLTDVKNRLVCVQAEVRGKSADLVGKQIAELIGTKETFAAVESRRMLVSV